MPFSPQSSSPLSYFLFLHLHTAGRTSPQEVFRQGRFVVWASLSPSPFPTLPRGYPPPTCSCPLPALGLLADSTPAQAAQMIGGKVGTRPGEVGRKAGLQSSSARLVECRTFWCTLQHLQPSSLSCPRESMPPFWGLSPSLLARGCLLSAAVIDSIYPNPPCWPPWLLLPCVIIADREPTAFQVPFQHRPSPPPLPERPPSLPFLLLPLLSAPLSPGSLQSSAGPHAYLVP